MNAKDARIKILNLQEQHCKNCEYRYQQLDHCRFNCAIGGTASISEKNHVKNFSVNVPLI
ncbi:hypothetical protein bcgnr5412_54370 [Bacillus cereus]